MTSREILRSALLAAALLAVLSSPVQASPPRWVADAVRAAPAAVHTECGYTVLLERTQMKVSRRLVAETRRRRVVRIESALAHGGDKLAVTLEPGAEIVAFHAWQVRGTDVESEAGLEKVVQASLSSQGYADSRLAFLQLSGARPGDVLAFEVAWREVCPFPSARWQPQLDPAPVSRADLSLDLPSKWTGAVYGYGAHGPVPTGPQNPVELTWVAVPELRAEERSAGPAETLPRIFVRFDSPDEAVRLDHWEKIATWFSDASRSSVAAEHCPTELVRAAEGVDRLERVRELARMVQSRLRYVAIELGDQRWIPDRADSTWLRGYGDCKDKAAVMVSALRRAGVDAAPVLVRTRDKGDVQPDSPDPSQFNHVVVAIAWDGDSTLSSVTVTGHDGRRWTVFDPTEESVPLGMISSAIGGARALIAVPGETLLTLPEASASRVAVNVRGAVEDDGSLRARLEMWFEGPEAEDLKGSLLRVSALELQRRVRSWVVARWPTAHMDTCQRIFRSQTSQGAGLRVDFLLPAFAYRAQGEWVVTPRFFMRNGSPAPRDSVRTTPILIGEPMLLDESWSLILPPTWSSPGAAPVSWEGDEGRYQLKTTSRANQLQWERQLEIRRRAAPPSRYEQARAFLQAIYSGDHLPVVALVR